ncbi:1,2-phenylacetyl-CoA epoxidase subunit PaaC [Halomarina ordinaria]|uniref:1,2-phenylacetyl-CoA epoxidase subunit PaaC n=1 Tax=Halomarina ordinaria TaxID=3033939 RepID=A0ABD5UE17_9EURY|nr:1,2-phenylacetyl-CoA epoxidase subunit PaaC [Halomarina sp. PSRA2]
MSAATLPGPNELDDRERAAVEALLRALADDEYVAAERYIDWQVRGPTLEADISIANIAQDELGHARLWYDLLQDFGYREQDLIWERAPDDFRHATLLELPFERGDWADCVLRSYFHDVAEHLRLEALAGSSYPRIADRVAKVQAEESYHREHAQNWLERLCDDDPGRERVQAALDRLFPYALTLFEPTEQEDAIVDLGVRTESIETLREDWLAIVVPFLESLGLRVTDGEVNLAALVPEAHGRDGTHTDHWQRLYNEMTYTYEQLGRREPRRIMRDPDDE